MPRNCLFPEINAVHEPATENLIAAWDELRPELARLVHALGVGSTNADDILQEVYLTAQEKCPRALNLEDLRRWLFRVTVNRCRLEHRHTGRWRRLFAGLTHLFDRHGQNHSAAEPLSRDEQRNQVRHALQSLDADTRSLLVLRYYADLDSNEIGRILDLPDATVRGRLRTARQKLADQLRHSGYQHDQ
jgi:RNA polymerase sigma-70 factor, ECF subfamily